MSAAVIIAYVLLAIPCWRRLLGRIYPWVVGGAPIPVFDELISIGAATVLSILWPLFALVWLVGRASDRANLTRQEVMGRLAVEPREERARRRKQEREEREEYIARLERELGLTGSNEGTA